MIKENVPYLRFLIFSLFAVVVLTQFQIDIPLSETSLRVGASDFIVVLTLLFFVFAAPKEVLLQKWKIKWLPLWFIGITSWLGISVLIGYAESGHLSNWAFCNKFLGWILLIGYFLLGGCTQYLNNDSLIRMFRILFISSWLVGIYCVINWMFRKY